MNCSYENDKIVICTECLKTNVPVIFECKCDNLLQMVFLEDDVCDILNASSFDRRLEEPLTVLSWDDPWMIASYILFGLLMLLSFMRIYSQCRVCRFIRLS